MQIRESNSGTKPTGKNALQFGTNLQTAGEEQTAEITGFTVKSLQQRRWLGKPSAFLKVGRLVRCANDATGFARNFERLTTLFFANVEDSFTKMLTTGKMNFTDFISSLINNLARLAIRQFILGPLVSGLGSLMGDMFCSWTTSSATSGAMADAIAWVSGSALSLTNPATLALFR
ncbi:MAG: phage tail tape measure C-terminal domain-containing protein [Desulfovibrio sp.]|uniref:phage tail tape measure C-terminal domain-containing protein n=1 Tax=Desulfovibrio sp. TaxID=885 RepID=UPI002A37046E|nr:phage tail tape measure C-terminal domain-containing protein [Desulfovibrio sp.]MDY0259634.1 phage tail tape measure C-terminal domain-containing protein [Desulfovibrio sp.]